MKAQVSTIKIKYGEKEIELTEEEAKALKDALNGLFAAPKSFAEKFGEQYGEIIRRQREVQEKMPSHSWPRPNIFPPQAYPMPVQPFGNPVITC